MATSPTTLHKIAHLTSSGRLDEAADVIIDALRSDPNSADLLVILALVEMDRDNPDAALAAASHAARLEPNSPQALRVLAEAYSATGHHYEAHHAAAAAVKADPHDPHCYAARAIVASRDAHASGRLRKTPEQRQLAAQAVADIDHAIGLDPHLPKLHHHKAVILAAAGHTDLARAACRRTLELDPNDADAHELMATINIKGHKTRGAHDHTVAALSVNPHASSLHHKMDYLSARRLLAPIGAMSIPATTATIGAIIVGGPPGWVVTVITLIGIVAASIYTWRWQRQLSEVERRTLHMGASKWRYRFAVVLWLALAALAIGHLVVDPFATPTFSEDGSRNIGLGELLWNLGPVVTGLVAARTVADLVRSRSDRSTASAPTGAAPDTTTT